MSGEARELLDERIRDWRGFVQRRASISVGDAEELESHLRDTIVELQDGGLREDEAFLIAVRRLGAVDALSREYAAEHSDRLWKQLVLGSDEAPSARGLSVALALAVAAGLAVQVPRLFGLSPDTAGGDYIKNLPLLVLPFLALFFVWRAAVEPARRARVLAVVGAGLAAGALALNLYPFAPDSATELLTALHLPIALWLLLGVAHAGGNWRSSGARMDYVRFTGEWFIYFSLIALGGGVLVGLSTAVFSAIDVDLETALFSYILPSGAAGAVLVAAWLVGAKQSVIENMAPVLTRVFTPLFTLMLLAFGVAAVVQRDAVTVERELLIVFDLVLIVVLGLLLYSVSARDPEAPSGLFDRLQVALLASAIVVDVYVLVAMLGRIGAFGVSPNKLASLGLNVLLLVNLAWSLVLLVSFIRGRRPFATLERWQTGYLPVFLAWTGFVALAFGPLFAWR